MTTALSIRDDQAGFDDKQLTALASLGVQNASPAEVALFFHQCQRTGLDPFARQIYMVGRWSSQHQRQMYTIQVGIDGLRTIADRAPGKRGMPYVAWCGADGVWVDAWIKPEPPLACKVVVTRDSEPFPAVATLGEYMQTGKNGKPTGLWGKMPATMLAKCAEALALRKAYPIDLSGLYTDDEMGQADNPHPSPKNAGNGEIETLRGEAQKLAVALGLTETQFNQTFVYVLKRQGASWDTASAADLAKVVNYLTERQAALNPHSQVVEAEIVEEGEA